MTMIIRLATPADAGQVQAIYGPYCHTPISFELDPPSVDEMRSRLVKVLAQNPWLVCEEDGNVLGYAYAGPHRERAAYRWSIDTTVYIRQGCHRRGIGRALYTSLLAALPLQGYVNAYAGVTLPNAGSIGLHKSMGFETIGVYRRVGFRGGAWHDVEWLQHLLQPLPEAPAPVKSLAEVRDLPEWIEAVASGMRLSR